MPDTPTERTLALRWITQLDEDAHFTYGGGPYADGTEEPPCPCARCTEVRQVFPTDPRRS